MGSQNIKRLISLSCSGLQCPVPIISSIHKQGWGSAEGEDNRWAVSPFQALHLLLAD